MKPLKNENNNNNRTKNKKKTVSVYNYLDGVHLLCRRVWKIITILCTLIFNEKKL